MKSNKLSSREECDHLNWFETTEEEHLDGLRRAEQRPPHLATHLGIGNAGADLAHAILEPTRVVLEVVVVVGAAGVVMAGAGRGDSEGEDDEAEEGESMRRR